jgi:hypothetical protein
VRDLVDALKGKVPEVYKIGDAREPKNIMNAVHDGAYFAELIW